MKAFNLRGTNGSGKTYVARQLLKLSNARPNQMVRHGKPLTYMGKLLDVPFIVFGSYETQCGGCDTIDSVKKVADLLHLWMKTKGEGLVFYEGLMISHMIGTVGAAAKEYGRDHMIGFLDTPLQVCIDRVKARRLERGNTAPFDPGRTLIKDYSAVQGAQRNALAQDFRVVAISHHSPVEQVLHHMQVLLAKDT